MAKQSTNTNETQKPPTGGPQPNAEAPKAQPTRPNQPEFKVGPLPGGLGVAVWRKVIQTDNGPRTIRSITIAPRRYRNSKTGAWEDASSYRPLDIPVLVLALEKTFDFCQSVSLDGVQTPMKEIPPASVDDDVPF